MTTKFHVYVSGHGPVPRERMIVGEAPGRDEIAEGRPFVGASGKRLNSALARYEVSRDSIYITNAFKGDVGPDNRDPTREELDDHLGILLGEIAQVEPGIIMTVGLIATRGLLPNLFPNSNSRLGPVVGQLHHSSVANVPVIPCYHPAAHLDHAKRALAESAVRRFLT